MCCDWCACLCLSECVYVCVLLFVVKEGRVKYFAYEACIVFILKRRQGINSLQKRRRLALPETLHALPHRDPPGL